MSWNYRVLKTKDGDDDLYQIHEVHYDKQGNVESYTKEGVTVTGNDIEDVKWVLMKMLSCLEKDVIKYEKL